jgi:hypothetical protein
MAKVRLSMARTIGSAYWSVMKVTAPNCGPPSAHNGSQHSATDGCAGEMLVRSFYNRCGIRPADADKGQCIVK